MSHIQHDSKDEVISQQPVGEHLWSQATIPGAGRLLAHVDDYRELNQTMVVNPRNPFSSDIDFNLASWFVRNKVAKSQIYTSLAEG